MIQAAQTIEGGKPLLYWKLQTEPVSNVTAHSELPELLHKLGMKARSSLFEDRERKPGGVREFLGPDGSYDTVPEAPIALGIHEGLTILGVPFELSATFVVSPGFALLYPEKVVAEASGRYVLPLVLRRVTLATASPALPDKLPAIHALLAEKYGHLAGMASRLRRDSSPTIGKRGRFRAYDQHGNEVQAGWDPQSMSISYYSDIAAEMEQVYQEFLVEEEAKRHATKPDLSGQL